MLKSDCRTEAGVLGPTRDTIVHIVIVLDFVWRCARDDDVSSMSPIARQG
jgi:hypothetical protein